MGQFEKMNKNIEYMLLGQVATYCEQVNTGTKLCAQITFQKEYLLSIKALIKQEKCKVIFLDEGENFKIGFIYKYVFVKLIIDEIVKRNIKDTPSAFEVWATGKLFGYSDYEISRYLKRHGYLNKAI